MSEKIYIGFWVFDQMAEESCQEVVEQANYLVPNPPECEGRGLGHETLGRWKSLGLEGQL